MKNIKNVKNPNEVQAKTTHLNNKFKNLTLNLNNQGMMINSPRAKGAVNMEELMIPQVTDHQNIQQINQQLRRKSTANVHQRKQPHFQRKDNFKINNNHQQKVIVPVSRWKSVSYYMKELIKSFDTIQPRSDPFFASFINVHKTFSDMRNLIPVNINMLQSKMIHLPPQGIFRVI